MRIGFVSEDFLLDNGILRPGGCSYYRMLLPKNTLKGHKTQFGPPAFTAEHGFGVRINSTEAEFGFDVIVMKMIMDRWNVRYMQMAQELGQRFIVDVDDFYPGLHETNRAFKITDPTVNKDRNREHHEQIVLQADLVTVSTPFLYEYYKPLVPDIVMVRNGINPEQFEKRTVRNTSKPVIGWAGAMNWRSNDVETAVPWLGEFLTEHDLMFHHAGDMPDAPKFWAKAGVPVDRMIHSRMRPLYRYHEMMEFDIGIVLLSDIPFNHAKSTIKGLEYAASNIPFVAEGLPEYALLAEQGVGRVATTGGEWKEQLAGLLDYRTRKQEAARQRALALKEHSITARAPEWVEVFNRFADHSTSLRNVIGRYAQA